MKSTQAESIKDGDILIRRTAICVEYDGTDFSGFQIQKNTRTVQESLEEAVASVYGKHCRIYGCSRTDAGVHARAHVSHMDLPFYIPSAKIPLALNTHLPEDVVVISAKEVSKDFHARFSCKGKIYTYRVSDAYQRPCIDRHSVAHIPGQIMIQPMQEAAQYIEGFQDYSAFCASEGLEKNPMRMINKVDVVRSSVTGYIEISVEGESFLYNMVRIIAGTLIYVGQGKIRPTDIPKMIQMKQRKLAGKTMPANGLTLERVFFDPNIF